MQLIDISGEKRGKYQIMLYLEVLHASGQREGYLVDAESVYVGRVPAVNDLFIDDGSLSRQHAQIKKGRAGYGIQDLES